MNMSRTHLLSGSGQHQGNLSRVKVVKRDQLVPYRVIDIRGTGLLGIYIYIGIIRAFTYSRMHYLVLMRQF